MRSLPPLAALLLLCACAKELPERMEISESRVLPPRHRAEIPDLPSEQRLGMRAPESQETDPGALAFVADTPEGWEKLPPAQFRDLNLRVQAHPEAECYLTRLSGDAGGLLANVNRWRSQMQQPPLAQKDIDSLERIELLHKPSPLLVIDGDYGGMGGMALQRDWRMYAVFHFVEPLRTTFTVKMIGPRAVLEAERAHFEQFVRSVRLEPIGAAHGTPAASSGGSPAAAPSAGSPSEPKPSAGAKTPERLRWSAPPHWQSGRTSSMRLATYHPHGKPEIELSIITLPGTGGGLTENVQRWYEQMQAPVPTESAVAAMPQLDVLGVAGTRVDVEGSYRGMGTEGQPGSRLLGVIAQPTPDFSVYIKLTGPKELVVAEEEHFLRLVQSLHFAN